MNKIVSSVLTFLTVHCLGVEKLQDSYCISYGNPNASIKIVEYFSFGCPQCIKLFNRDFQKLKENYINKGELFWTFHPNPVDLTTVQAMACLEKLSPRQKQVFLEAILSEAQGASSYELVTMMKKGLEILGTPLPSLDKMDYLRTTQAYDCAFAFISQKTPIEEVPTVEVNGVLQDALPDEVFIDKVMKQAKVDDSIIARSQAL